jgi:rfaE bifunctional protein kinase chain/domain
MADDRNSGNGWLEASLAGIAQTQIAVFGDFCLDAYWLLESQEQERSLETNLPLRRVRRQRYSLGAAGNVIANLVDLGVKRVWAVGVVGRDIFGNEMISQMQACGVDTTALLNTQDDWQTMVYAKPYRDEQEQNRFDFGAFNRLRPETIRALAGQLDHLAGECAAVILNQQIPAGSSPPEMITELNRIIARHPQTRFIVDSRHRPDQYRGAILKLNAHEAARLAGEPQAEDERLTGKQARHYAQVIQDRTGFPVFVTRGDRGMVVAESGRVEEVPGIQIVDRTDTVGAGDTVAATIAAALAGGSEPVAAARLANIAASITVRKLQTTGTASPAEIRAVGPTPDYVYLPDLAEDARHAQYLADTEIELVCKLPNMHIRHAIFDHDGTLSTLRQGWEQIMEPMMVRAVLGARYQNAEESLYLKVVDAVRQFIDKTTGIQTLVQMHGLVQLVRRFQCVPEQDILDPAAYKKVYNDDLLAMVKLRVAKLERGELESVDFQVKNAAHLLRALQEHGVKLYLASGTDVADVIAEAKAMGYAHRFEDRIFGAVGDVKVEAKKLVLERIIREHKLSGPELVTFGDGPVEIRETRKCGGVTVGVASDEVRRWGLNASKRSRLIRAGADLIVPDFSQLPALLRTLQLDGRIQ